MSIINTLLLLVSLISSLLMHTYFAAKLKDITSMTSLKEICQIAENPKLCESSVGSRVGGKTSVEAVVQKQMEATLAEIDRAEKESAHLAAKDPKDDKRNACFTDCAAQFHKAQAILNDALKAHAANDIPKLETLLGNAIDHFEACDDSFEDSGLDPMLEETTHQLQRLTANCQYLTRALE